MIVVTGTKRSGTSMWMQILHGAGFPHVGQAFPRNWDLSIRDANPEGFYESTLRHGINWTSNPHPITGHYLVPGAHPQHAVKVFCDGVVRSERAFLSKVIVTLRPWREYRSSIHRLYALEDAHLATLGPEALEKGKAQRPPVAPEIEWFFDNYGLLRDLLVRRYPVHFVSYPRLLADPEVEISRVLNWLGRPEAVAACVPLVRADLRTQHPDTTSGSEVLTEAHIQTFDDYFDAMHHQRGLTSELIGRLNQAAADLDPKAKRRAEAVDVDHPSRQDPSQ